MKKLFTATEIVAMNLPDLPTTKRAIQLRALKEGWQFESKVGLGGTRKVFAIPSQYLDGQGVVTAPGEDSVGEAPATAPSQVGLHSGPAAKGEPSKKVIGTIAGGSAKVDLSLLETAMRALSEWERERHTKVADDRRSAIVAILYDYLQSAEDNGEEAMSVVLRALG